MGLLSVLLKDPITFILLAVSLGFSVIAHEVAHGWVALLFGDDTAKQSGRLSFNPMLHLDPIGTIALFIVGFGWAKPVPVNYSKLSRSRAALISVSLAGCVTNILIAAIAVFLLHLHWVSAHSSLVQVLLLVARINTILGALNLIPIPPLDGSKVLMAFLPYEVQVNLGRIEPYGFFILIFLLFTGILTPVIVFVQRLLFSVIGILLSFMK